MLGLFRTIKRACYVPPRFLAWATSYGVVRKYLAALLLLSSSWPPAGSPAEHKQCTGPQHQQVRSAVTMVQDRIMTVIMTEHKVRAARKPKK